MSKTKPAVVSVELPKGLFWAYDEEDRVWEIFRVAGTHWSDVLEWLAQYLVCEEAKKQETAV